MPDTRPSGGGVNNLNPASNTTTVGSANTPPVEDLVTCDQTTITGDGTTRNPLRATGGGGSVTHDGTLVGVGTEADPLGVAIAAPGTVGRVILGAGASPQTAHAEYIADGMQILADATAPGSAPNGRAFEIASTAGAPAPGTFIDGINAVFYADIFGSTPVATLVAATAGSLYWDMSGTSGTLITQFPTLVLAGGTDGTGGGIKVDPGTYPVVVSGTGLGGSGTTGNPLVTVPGGTEVAVGASIAGNGLNSSPLVTVAFKTPVKTDGTTVFGSGTVADPITTFPLTRQTFSYVCTGAEGASFPIVFSSPRGNINYTVTPSFGGPNTTAFKMIRSLVSSYTINGFTVELSAAVEAGEILQFTVEDTNA